MSDMVMVVTLICLAIGLALVYVLRNLLARQRTLPVSVDWIRDLSVARYRPMERLLDDGDYDFLASQPGADRALIRRVRTERRKVFRAYLRCLERDFGRVCMALKILILESAYDRPDLARVLVRQKMMFRYGVLLVHLRLAMDVFGWGKVDVRDLLTAFDRLGSELQQIIQVPDSMAASA